MVKAGVTMTKGDKGQGRRFTNSRHARYSRNKFRLSNARIYRENKIDMYMYGIAKKRVEQFDGNLIDADDIVKDFNLDIDEIFALADEVELEE